MSQQKILTICIPTYKRAKKLDYSLSCFERELNQVDSSLLEFFISDNCSPDNTAEVVEKYIQRGMPITYSRNQENIGPDNNFLKCFYYAKSKYLWLLGDDDYLLEGRLKIILDTLNDSNIGCLNIVNPLNCSKGIYKYTNNEKFLRKVSHYFTFMSANIINTSSISSTLVTESLRQSNLLQMPFFINSALSSPTNILIKDKFFERTDYNDNGGYNFFNVFIRNYLNIWKNYFNNNSIGWFTYWEIKRKLLWNYIMPYLVYFNIQNRFPNMDKSGGWKILLRNYWYEPYFYIYILKIPYILYKSDWNTKSNI